MEKITVGPFEFHDKIPLKHDLPAAGVRVVPPGVARYGAFLERGVILMPGYVNIGARVGAGTMVDTWATVGSCAQIGSDCHLAGGVGIGGVLEPASAQPVIVEDGVFVGSRVVIVEGMHIGREAVIGAGVVLTSTTVILDVTGPRARRAPGSRAGAQRRHPGRAPEEVPRGRVQRALRAHHRAAQRQHRPQGEPQRGASRLRSAGVSATSAPEVDADVQRRLDATLLELCVDRLAHRGRASALRRRSGAPREARARRRPSAATATRSSCRSRAAAGPRVALVGHLDTVRTENGPARIEGDRCFGSGASDMKSGLAVMITLAETLPRGGSALRSRRSSSTRARKGRSPRTSSGRSSTQDPELGDVDLAVCMEPSDNKLHLGCVGSIHATVTFRGRTAHSARPWEGDNAITQAGALLGELRALRPKESLIEGLTYRSVTTVTQAKDGGRGRNVVPDLFVLNVNRRFAPDVTLEEARQDLVSLVGGRADIEFTDLSPAARPSAEHPLVRALVAAGVRARRAQASLDRRGPLRGPRRRRGQLRPRRERAGAPEKRVHVARPAPWRLRHHRALAAGHFPRVCLRRRGRRL